VQLSRELDLIARCCRWNFPGEDRSLTLSGDLDWQRVVRLARFHRVQGLVWRALSDSGGCPEEAAEALSGDSARIAAANLVAAAECRRLLAQFTAAQVKLLFVKGLTLAALVYGSATSKSAVDIDILIRPEELTRAADLLRELGYRPIAPPGAGDVALRRWHRRRKESAWTRPGSSIAVDLHTGLADNPRLIAGIDADSASRSVDIGNGIALPTLAPDALFAYLAVHGASSAWFRLKWISDFAALVSPLEPAELARLYRRSQELDAGRAPGQALLLSDTLFDTLDRVPELRAELRRDGTIHRLHRAALGQLAGRAEPVEPTSTPLGTRTIHWTQFLLQPGIRFKWSELRRQARLLLP